MKKISSLLGVALGIFLASEAQASSQEKFGGMWDGPQEKVTHHPTGPNRNHALEERREHIRKEINEAHTILSQFSKLYNAMHAMRLEVEGMNTKVRGKPADQKRLVTLEKEWNKAQSELRVGLIRKKVLPFDSLRPDRGMEREIWDNFPNDEASTLEKTLREVRRWQSYANIDLQTGETKQQGGNLYDEKPSGKNLDFTKVRLSDLSDDEDF